MNYCLFRRVLAIGAACAGLAGCQSGGEKVERSSSSSKPADPTAWTGSEISKDDDAPTASRPKSSRLQGGWSSEARDIERSMGVGR